MAVSDLEQLVARHRKYFLTGKTRPAEWREAQRSEASGFPGLSAVRSRLQLLHFGRNSRNFGARLRDSWSASVRLAESQLMRLKSGLSDF